MIPEMIATLASGIFFGAAVYINLVEQPARIFCGMALAITEWRPSYKRATLMQAPLALVGSAAALIAWWFHGSAAWLIGGLLFLAIEQRMDGAVGRNFPENRRIRRSRIFRAPQLVCSRFTFRM